MEKYIRSQVVLDMDDIRKFFAELEESYLVDLLNSTFHQNIQGTITDISRSFNHLTISIDEDN